MFEILLFFQSLLADMTDKEFETYKEALVLKATEKPKGFIEQAATYLMEIDTGDYNFDRAQAEADALKTMDKDDVIEFYDVRHL